MENVNNKKVHHAVTTSSMSVQVSPSKPETVSFGTSMEDLDQFKKDIEFFQVSPAKPETISFGTSMEDLDQFRKDVELIEREKMIKEQQEQQEKLKKEQEEHLERYQLEMEKKIRDMTEKFAAQITEAARLSGEDGDTDFNYSGTDLDLTDVEK